MPATAGLLAIVALLLASLACGDEPTMDHTKKMGALREQVRTRTASLLEALARLGFTAVFANGEYYSCSADEADSLVKRHEWSYRASGRVELSPAGATDRTGTVATVLENQSWSLTRAGVLNNGRRGVAAELHDLKLGAGVYEELPGEPLLISVSGPCACGEQGADRHRRVGAEDIEVPRSG